jgi:CBS domain-containing protein
MEPSAGLLQILRAELAQRPPFDQMAGPAVDFFISRSRQMYFGPGERVLEPANGPVRDLLLVRSGSVTGARGLADAPGASFAYEAGDLFPSAAAMAGRAVTATYTSSGDTFLMALPAPAMRELMAMSPPFAEHMNQRMLKFLERSEDAMRQAYASRVLTGKSLETPLAELVRTSAVTCASGTLLRDALHEMHRLRIGSLVVADVAGRAQGILTRFDVLGRVALAGLSLDTAIDEVMTRPVHVLSGDATAQDAMLLMSRHAIRHVPVTQAGAVVGMVSERDLFALQRTSVAHVGTMIRAGEDVHALKLAAAEIRRFAHGLLGHGVNARQVSSLVSHLNDLLTWRLVEIVAPDHGVDLRRLCWLALGSEGRGEQTIATDQDNALVLRDDSTSEERAAALRFGRAVNLALDACGYPLCKGGIMAGEPKCCKTLTQWRDEFERWIGHGAPQDLLDACIYFDFRRIGGDEAMAASLRAEVTWMAARSPRFQKQLEDIALQRTVPLDWRGAISTDEDGGVDLKLQGAAIFVDAARLYSLAHGTTATSTRERLQAAGVAMGTAAEADTWVGAFEFIQMLRLRVQLEPRSHGAASNPNRIVLASLNALDRRVLRESFKVARELQQRMRLDYER